MAPSPLHRRGLMRRWLYNHVLRHWYNVCWFARTGRWYPALGPITPEVEAWARQAFEDERV